MAGHDLGLMVTDAIREYLGLDMIFYNKGGIRINKLSGEVKAKDIYAMHPFGNYIVEIRMDTSEIKELIKNDYEGHRGIDIIPSGLTYRITRDLNKKVHKVELFDLNGYPIDEGKTFRVGINNYIASSYKFTHKDPGRSTNSKTVDIMLRFFSTLKKKLNYTNRVRSEEKIIYEGNVKPIGISETDIYVAKKKFYENSPAGNLISDAMRIHSGSDIALFPTRLLRGDLPIWKGMDIYKEAFPDLYNFIKQSKVIKIKMTGKQIKDFILKRSGNKNNIDLQISGGNYSVIYGQDNKVKNIELVFNGVSGFKPSTIYSVALIEYEYNNFYSLKKYIKDTNIIQEELDRILAGYIIKLGKVPQSIAIKRIKLIRDKNN